MENWPTFINFLGKLSFSDVLPTKVCLLYALSETILLFGLHYLHNDDHKSNTQQLNYRTNDENSRSNSLLTLKSELLFQMTEQSYPRLLTLTIGFIPFYSILVKN